MGDGKRYAAEFIGTLLLVFVGVGSAVTSLVEGGVVVVSLAFAFILLAVVYVFGPVSGAHVNPAITLGALLTGRISVAGAIGYWVAQVAGAVVGAFLLLVLSRWGDVVDQTGRLGANEYGSTVNLAGTIVLEAVCTFALVLVFLVVTGRAEQTRVTGLAIGLTLGAVTLLGLTLDGISVNPARSIGPAVFEGGAALEQLWVFVVVPLLGGILAAMALPLTLSDGWRSPVDPDNPPPR